MVSVAVSHRELVDMLGASRPWPEIVDAIVMMGASLEGREGESATFEVFPSRPDLYSVEGLARALRGFLGIEVGLVRYAVHPSGIAFTVDPALRDVRPFGVGGVVRGLELDDATVRSIVALQENLHTTVGRRRRKVAIGIHDLREVVPPFRYVAAEPESHRFTPLGLAREMSPAEILRNHPKGLEFGPILADARRVPLIVDANDVVLSFPPIINGVATELTPETRDVFLDVTGTDLDAVSAVLAILATALGDRGGAIESVETTAAGRTWTTPNLETHIRIVDVVEANAILGVSISPDRAIELLRRMRYDAHAQGSKLAVEIPRYRIDVMHAWDVYEDLAIAYGFDRIPPALPVRQTIGAPVPMNEFTNALRDLLVGYGYQEVVSLTMTNPREPFRTPNGATIANPIQAEYTTLRTSLLPALLGILKLNTHRDLPQRIFEVGEVVLSARNVRRLAAVSIHPKASFTESKSLALSLLRDVGTTAQIEPAPDENFIAGRCATATVDGIPIGVFGEVHPRVLEAYGLGNPVIALELDAEPLAPA